MRAKIYWLRKAEGLRLSKKDVCTFEVILCIFGIYHLSGFFLEPEKCSLAVDT